MINKSKPVIIICFIIIVSFCLLSFINFGSLVKVYCFSNISQDRVEYNDKTLYRQIQDKDLYQVKGERSFLIKGNGITSEQSRDMIGKWFDWWPWFATGIWCGSNEKITINVDNDIDVAIGTKNMSPHTGSNTLRQTLKNGTTTIEHSRAGLLYFSLFHSGTINVSITSGGTDSPLFTLDKHSQAEWQSMLNNMTQSGVCELQTDRLYMCITRNKALEYLSSKDPSPLLRKIDESIVLEDMLAGQTPNAPKQKNRPDVFKLAMIEDTTINSSLMYASSTMTGYSSKNVGAILDVNKYTTNGWGPWHEQGHTRQINSFRWSGNLTEVTNNIFSMWIQANFGNGSSLEPTDYEKAFNYLNQSNKNYDDVSELFIKLIMFWQLHLSFGKNFYPKLHQMCREIDLTQHPAANSGEFGKQFFIYITSMCAERNLAPFYEKWGVYPSEDTIKKIKDYPSLSKSIWQSRDSTPVVEYNIPDNFVVPEIPSSQPPQNLDGQDIIIDSAIDLTFSVSDKSGKIQMWNNSSSSTNVWQIQASSNNTYLIKNKFTNQYIQEDGYGLSLNNNANNATKWDLIHLSSGVMGHSYRIKSSSSDLVFDVTNGGQPQNGTDVIAYPQTGNDNQRFFLDFINYDPPTTSPPPTEPPPVETVEPDQVTGLTLLKIENDIYLDWRESKNATHYRVYKSFDNVTYFIDSEQQDTNYLDKDATLYQMVMYFVKAVNNDIEGPDSITVEYESSDGSNETNENPKEVTGLQLLVVGNNLELIWNYVNNATYYRVYKSIEDSNYIIDSEQENIMYTDKGAAKYSKVNYFVRAVNNGVESGDGKIVEYTLSNNNGDNNDENNNSNNDLGDRNDIDIIITIAAICICIIVVLIFFNIIFVKKRY